jgi:hypothetical protein
MIAIAIAALVATPDFPAAIQRQLALAGPPRCTVCHATDSGGAGTVVHSFGTYLQSRGLQPGDEDSLRNALLADIAEHHSSNGGLSTDVDALHAGLDPNGTATVVPTYGCSTRGSGPGALASLLAGMWIATRRRGRNQREGCEVESGRRPAAGCDAAVPD